MIWVSFSFSEEFYVRGIISLENFRPCRFLSTSEMTATQFGILAWFSVSSPDIQDTYLFLAGAVYLVINVRHIKRGKC